MAFSPPDAEPGHVRIAPRFDRWMIWVLSLSGLAMVAAGVAPAFDPAATAGDLAFTLSTSVGVALIVVLLTVPLRYEMDLDEVRVRSGVLRQRMRIADVVKVQTFVSPLASPTAPFTSQRVRLVSSRGATLDVGPRDRTGFVAELLARAPHLEERRVGGRRMWIDPRRT